MRDSMARQVSGVPKRKTPTLALDSSARIRIHIPRKFSPAATRTQGSAYSADRYEKRANLPWQRDAGTANAARVFVTGIRGMREVTVLFLEPAGT